jgi:4-amino-4-deoxy-L-arabinose transferase-like glycosyltransferase
LVDPPLIFFMTAGLACWWRMEMAAGDGSGGGAPRATRYGWWCLLGGISIGGAMLSKGPLGLLPGVVALGYVVARRDWSFFFRAKWALLVGVVAIVAVAAPWYWAVAQRAGAEFTEEFFVEHNLGRFTSPMQGHEGPFFYYVPVVILGMLPWTFFLATMWHAPRRRLDRFDLMLAMWAAIPFALFSFTMATKLPHYIAFSFPALALLVAREIVWRASDAGRFAGRGGSWLAIGWWLWVVVGGLLIVSAFVAPIWVIDFPRAAVIAPGVVLMAGFLWAALGWRRDRDVVVASWRAGATMALFFLVAANVSLRLSDSLQSLIRATTAAVAMAEEDDGSLDRGDIFVMGYYEPSLFFYTRGAMIAEKDEREVRRFASEVEPGRVVYFVCRRKHLPEMLWYIRDGEQYDTETFEFDSVREDDDKFNIRVVRAVKRAPE